MTGTRQYRFVTTDRNTGRVVRHQWVPADTRWTALERVLRRRYRLPADARVVTQPYAGAPGTGTFEVFFGAYVKPAHTGYYVHTDYRPAEVA